MAQNDSLGISPDHGISNVRDAVSEPRSGEDFAAGRAAWQDALQHAGSNPVEPGVSSETSPSAGGSVAPASNTHINAAAASVDTPQARAALADKLVRAGHDASAEDIAAVRQHITANDPADALRLMDKYGIHVQVTRGSVAMEIPALKDTQPRGWGPGEMQKVTGICDQEHRAAIVATQDGPGGGRRMPDAREEGSVDVVLHEGGHGIDASASMWGKMSDKAAFVNAYKQDGTSAPFDRPYFHQGNDGPAGRSEAWAEGFALYNRNPTAMQQGQPHMFAYFRDLMKFKLPQASQ